MKQIVVISGKGGTGKTVITAAFASLLKNKLIVDCDVDAPDLHLLLAPEILEQHIFKGGVLAKIDSDKCTQCGHCKEHCRFEAINKNFIVDPISCEGCGFCYHVCPSKAITLEDRISGEWFISATRYGTLIHAQLGIAEANSGKLIALLRKQAAAIAEKKQLELVLIDGAPGISCPLIACITNTDCAIVVTEPTLSGLHDADRVIKVAQHFKIPVKVIINKYDLNTFMSKKIVQHCADENIAVIGKIPFAAGIVDLMRTGKTIMESSDSQLKNVIQQIWDNLITDILS